MAWLSFFSLPSDAKLRELAHHVAARCQVAVQDRVAARLGELQLSEARGYVRARSSTIIRREVDQLVSQQPGLHSVSSQLQRLASEAAIRQVIWQMLRDRKQCQTSTTDLRRAA
jgi:hypothetical protein